MTPSKTIFAQSRARLSFLGLAALTALLPQLLPSPVEAFSFNRKSYNPAILTLGYTVDRGVEKSSGSGSGSQAETAFVDITLITRDGEAIGRRVSVSTQQFSQQLRALYAQLAKQESLDTGNAASPSRQIYSALIAPVAQDLRALGVTTLLIAAERGLQGVPYAALHDGDRFLGERYAFSLTPSLQFTSLAPPLQSPPEILAAGASKFDGLAPLPLVPQEVGGAAQGRASQTRLDQEFTPSVLIDQAADPRYNRVHLATHADFKPGGPSKSLLYTGTAPVPLSDFLRIRQRRDRDVLDLFVLSACRTALGDSSSEMGFAGLALQAGARSAIGTLWYVDDVATSAYFLQLYRYLDQGLPKAEALQATRIAFAQGLVHVKGDSMIGAGGAVLLTKLTPQQVRRVQDGLAHPFFWAGIELLGSPW